MKKTAFIKLNAAEVNATTLQVKKEEIKENLLEALATMENEPEDSDAEVTKIEYEVPDNDADDSVKQKFAEKDTIEVISVTPVTEAEIDTYIRENTNDFIEDERSFIRIQAAKRKYGLSTLISDENSYVRVAVAETGYKPEVLIKDESKWVRMAVARTGYGLDELVNDSSSYVRAEVARQGYELDVLVNDKDSYVRAEVVRQGYAWDILVNDENSHVRKTIAELSTEDKKHLPQLANDLDRDVRVAVAGNADEDILAILVKDDSVYVRIAVAKRGYGLEQLAEDEDSYVRAEVAKTGKCSEKFVEDENWHVRFEAASASGDEAYLKDSNPAVRKAAWDKIHAQEEK